MKHPVDIDGWCGHRNRQQPVLFAPHEQIARSVQIKASILVGAELQLKGGDIETTCSVVATPLYDPAKIRTHA